MVVFLSSPPIEIFVTTFLKHLCGKRSNKSSLFCDIFLFKTCQDDNYKNRTKNSIVFAHMVHIVN